ncbi:MFS transporter [Listeria aquatica]|uniref:MFS transporter n=1 Tax=Listeria aquatica TaxID=1494960 RepID=UPI003EF79660
MERNQPPVPEKKALVFGLISIFLCGLGLSIITPVIPFLVAPYVTTPANQAFIVTTLTSVYAVCVFLASPSLGALSDRLGRRPVLLVCLLGSAVGYLIFGIGGALWVLFLGRILEGITGGSISTLFAYFADITPASERTKYFGWVSALFGTGVAIGPAIGGLLTHFGYAAPMFFGAIVTFLNFVFGILYIPESLAQEKRLKRIKRSQLNPFTQLVHLFSMKQLARLFIAGLLIWIPNGSLQAIFSQFTKDTFQWQPVLIGLTFSIMGIQDIVAQGLVMPKLLKKFSDTEIAKFGLILDVLGYAFIASSAIFQFAPLFVVGMFVFGFGDSLFGPAFNGILSKSVSSSEQGRIQGSSQSVQSLARIIGPVIGGQIYVLFGHTAPAIMGVLLISLAIPIFTRQNTSEIQKN